MSGGKISQVYTIRSQALNLDTVIQIFHTIDSTKLSTIPPIKPKGGEIYVYKISRYQKRDIWKDDHYRWQCKGRKLIPRKNPMFKKYYFDIKMGPSSSSADFQRHAYYAIVVDDFPYVVVHYIGDQDKARDGMYFPECSFEGYGYTRILPSFLTDTFIRYCESSPLRFADDNEDINYNVMLDPTSSSNSGGMLPLDSSGLLPPMNEETVETTTYSISQESTSQEDPFVIKELPINQSSIYMAYLFANNVKDFIWKIDIFPEVMLVAGAKPLIDEINKVLTISSPLPQLISYDTKYVVGDFYISPFLVRHTAFEGGPSIPILFLLHETKFNKVRDEIFPYVSNLVPALNDEKHPLVTYWEANIVKASEKYLSNLPILINWNEVMNKVKQWVSQNLGDDDIGYYTEQLMDLFDSENNHEYESKLEDFQNLWPESFKKYYFKKIHPQVNAHLGSWLFMDHNVYSPYSGVMRNESTHLNTVLACLQKYKGVPLDVILQALWYLQVYTFEEIQLSYADQGIFKLLPSLEYLKTEDLLQEYTSKTSSLEEVIEEICSSQNLVENTME